MAGLLGGLECERARGGGAQRGVNAQEWDGGEMRKGLGEGFAGWRNSSRNPIPTVGSVHSADASWAIRGAPTPSVCTPLIKHWALNKWRQSVVDLRVHQQQRQGHRVTNSKAGSRAPAQKKADLPSRPLGGLHHPNSSQNVEKCLFLFVVFKQTEGLTPRKKRAAHEMCLQAGTTCSMLDVSFLDRVLLYTPLARLALAVGPRMVSNSW